MNKEYAYIDGKVIVIDENGKLTQRDYKENIEKILVQENVVEKIEKDIKELEKEVNKFKKEKHIKFPAVTLSFLLFSALITCIPFIIGLRLNLISIIFFIAIHLPFISCAPLLDKALIFDSLKKHQVVVSEIEYLKGMLTNQKEILAEMQKEAALNKDKIEEVKGIKVADRKIMEALDNEEYLYYDAGLNLKKYYLLYKKGKLAELLANYYNQDGIELVTEFVKENGPRLVRKI